MGFLDIASHCLKQWVVFIITVFFQEATPAPTKKNLQLGAKKDVSG